MTTSWDEHVAVWLRWELWGLAVRRKHSQNPLLGIFNGVKTSVTCLIMDYLSQGKQGEKSRPPRCPSWSHRPEQPWNKPQHLESPGYETYDHIQFNVYTGVCPWELINPHTLLPHFTNIHTNHSWAFSDAETCSYTHTHSLKVLFLFLYDIYFFKCILYSNLCKMPLFNYNA